MGNGKEEKGHCDDMKDDEENCGKKISLMEERKGEKNIGALKEKRDHERKIRRSEDSSETKRSHIGRRKGKRKDSRQCMEDGWGGGLVKGLLLPQNVPVTSIHFRPGDKTTYLLGTSSGEVLLVSGCRFFFIHTNNNILKIDHSFSIVLMCKKKYKFTLSFMFVFILAKNTIQEHFFSVQKKILVVALNL